jgi:hypothetical protein
MPTLAKFLAVLTSIERPTPRERYPCIRRWKSENTVEPMANFM